MANLGLAIGLPLGLLAALGLGILALFLYWKYYRNKKGSWSRQDDPEINGMDRERKKSGIVIRQPSRDGGDLYVVRHFHEAQNDDQLTLHTGRFVEVIEKDSSSTPGWWRGTIDDHTGWFPADCVRPMSVHDYKALHEDPSVAEKGPPGNGLIEMLGAPPHDSCLGEDNAGLSVSREEIPKITEIQLVPSQSVHTESSPPKVNGHATNVDASLKPKEDEPSLTQTDGEVTSRAQLNGDIVKTDSEPAMAKKLKPIVQAARKTEKQLTIKRKCNTGTYDNVEVSKYSSGGYDNWNVEQGYDNVVINVTDEKLPVLASVSDGNYDEVQTVKCAIVTAKAKSCTLDSLNRAADVCSKNEQEIEELSARHAKKQYYVAMYPFVGTTSEQLSLRPNDVVCSECGEENGWMKGQLVGSEGLMGWFPSSYVRQAKSPHTTRKVLSPLPALDVSGADSDGTLESTFMDDPNEFDHDDSAEMTGLAYESVHPYTAQQEGDLSFTAGQTIIVMETLDNGWWRGCCEGQDGWFPGSYVQAIPQTPAVNSMTAPEFPKTETEPPLAFSSPRDHNQQDEGTSNPTLDICTSPIPGPVNDHEIPEPSPQKPEVPRRYVVPKLVKIPKSTFSSLSWKKGDKPKHSEPAPLPPEVTGVKDTRQEQEVLYRTTAVIKRASISRPSVPPPEPPKGHNQDAVKQLADLVASKEVIVYSDVISVDYGIDTKLKTKSTSKSSGVLEEFKQKYDIPNGEVVEDGDKVNLSGEFNNILASLNRDIEALYDSVAKELDTSLESEHDVLKTDKTESKSSDVGGESVSKTTVDVAIQPDTITESVRPVMEVRPYNGAKVEVQQPPPPRPAPPHALTNGHKQEEPSPPSPEKTPPKRPDAPPRGLSSSVLRRIHEKQSTKQQKQNVADNYGLFERTRPALPPKPSPSKVRKYKRSHSDLGLSIIGKNGDTVHNVSIDIQAMVLETENGHKTKTAPPRPSKPPRYARSKSLSALMLEVNSESDIDTDNILHLNGTETCVDTGEVLDLSAESTIDPPEGFENDPTPVILISDPDIEVTSLPVDDDPLPVNDDPIPVIPGLLPIDIDLDNVKVNETLPQDILSKSLSNTQPEDQNPILVKTIIPIHDTDSLQVESPRTPPPLHMGKKDMGVTPTIMLKAQKAGLSHFSDPNADTLTPAKGLDDSDVNVVVGKDVGMTPKIMLQYRGAQLTEYSDAKKTLNFEGEPSKSSETGDQQEEDCSDSSSDTLTETSVDGPDFQSVEQTENHLDMNKNYNVDIPNVGVTESLVISEGHPDKAVVSKNDMTQRHLRFYTPAAYVPPPPTSHSDLDLSPTSFSKSSVDIRPVHPVLESGVSNESGTHGGSVDPALPRPYKSRSLPPGQSLVTMDTVVTKETHSVSQTHRTLETGGDDYRFQYELAAEEGEESIV